MTERTSTGLETVEEPSAIYKPRQEHAISPDEQSYVLRLVITEAAVQGSPQVAFLGIPQAPLEFQQEQLAFSS